MGTTNPAFAAYAIASTIVALHFFVMSGYTGRVRAKAKHYTNPEDAGFFKVNAAEGDHPDVERVRRAHANLIESAVPFFVVGALYAATGPSKEAALAYYGSFVAARLLHSIVYIWGKQPYRTICFVVGVLSVVGMAVHVLRFYA